MQTMSYVSAAKRPTHVSYEDWTAAGKTQMPWFAELEKNWFGPEMRLQHRSASVTSGAGPPTTQALPATSVVSAASGSRRSVEACIFVKDVTCLVAVFVRWGGVGMQVLEALAR